MLLPRNLNPVILALQGTPASKIATDIMSIVKASPHFFMDKRQRAVEDEMYHLFSFIPKLLTEENQKDACRLLMMVNPVRYLVRLCKSIRQQPSHRFNLKFPFEPEFEAELFSLAMETVRPWIKTRKLAEDVLIDPDFFENVEVVKMFMGQHSWILANFEGYHPDEWDPTHITNMIMYMGDDPSHECVCFVITKILHLSSIMSIESEMVSMITAIMRFTPVSADNLDMALRLCKHCADYNPKFASIMVAHAIPSLVRMFREDFKSFMAIYRDNMYISFMSEYMGQFVLKVSQSLSDPETRAQMFEFMNMVMNHINKPYSYFDVSAVRARRALLYRTPASLRRVRLFLDDELQVPLAEISKHHPFFAVFASEIAWPVDVYVAALDKFVSEAQWSAPNIPFWDQIASRLDSFHTNREFCTAVKNSFRRQHVVGHFLHAARHAWDGSVPSEKKTLVPAFSLVVEFLRENNLLDKLCFDVVNERIYINAPSWFRHANDPAVKLKRGSTTFELTLCIFNGHSSRFNRMVGDKSCFADIFSAGMKLVCNREDLEDPPPGIPITSLTRFAREIFGREVPNRRLSPALIALFQIHNRRDFPEYLKVNWVIQFVSEAWHMSVRRYPQIRPVSSTYPPDVNSKILPPMSRVNVTKTNILFKLYHGIDLFTVVRMSEHTGKIVRDSGLFEYSFFAFAVQPAFREVFPIFYKVFPDSTDPAHGERIDLIKNFISEYEKLNLFGPDNTYTDKKKNEYLDGPSSDIDEYLCISRANVTKYGCQLHSMDPCPVVSDRVIECLGIPIHSQIFGNHQTLMRLAVKKRMEMEFAEVSTLVRYMCYKRYLEFRDCEDLVFSNCITGINTYDSDETRFTCNGPIKWALDQELRGSCLNGLNEFSSSLIPVYPLDDSPTVGLIERQRCVVLTAMFYHGDEAQGDNLPDFRWASPPRYPHVVNGELAAVCLSDTGLNAQSVDKGKLPSKRAARRSKTADRQVRPKLLVKTRSMRQSERFLGPSAEETISLLESEDELDIEPAPQPVNADKKLNPALHQSDDFLFTSLYYGMVRRHLKRGPFDPNDDQKKTGSYSKFRAGIPDMFWTLRYQSLYHARMGDMVETFFYAKSPVLGVTEPNGILTEINQNIIRAHVCAWIKSFKTMWRRTKIDVQALFDMRNDPNYPTYLHIELCGRLVSVEVFCKRPRSFNDPRAGFYLVMGPNYKAGIEHHWDTNRKFKDPSSIVSKMIDSRVGICCM